MSGTACNETFALIRDTWNQNNNDFVEQSIHRWLSTPALVYIYHCALIYQSQVVMQLKWDAAHYDHKSFSAEQLVWSACCARVYISDWCTHTHVHTYVRTSGSLASCQHALDDCSHSHNKYLPQITLQSPIDAYLDSEKVCHFSMVLWTLLF